MIEHENNPLTAKDSKALRKEHEELMYKDLALRALRKLRGLCG